MGEQLKGVYELDHQIIEREIFQLSNPTLLTAKWNLLYIFIHILIYEYSEGG